MCNEVIRICGIGESANRPGEYSISARTARRGRECGCGQPSPRDEGDDLVCDVLLCRPVHCLSWQVCPGKSWSATVPHGPHSPERYGPAQTVYFQHFDLIATHLVQLVPSRGRQWRGKLRTVSQPTDSRGLKLPRKRRRTADKSGPVRPAPSPDGLGTEGQNRRTRTATGSIASVATREEAKRAVVFR